MSFYANFQTAGPVQEPGRAQVRNLAGMTASQNFNAANNFSSALANTNNTAHETLPSCIDPRLLSMSSTGFQYPTHNAVLSSADQFTSSLQSSYIYEPLQLIGAHCERPFRETRSRKRNPPSRLSTKSVGSESQSYKSSTRNRQKRSRSDDSKLAASLQTPSLTDRRRRDIKAVYRAAAAKTPESSTSAKSKGKSDSVVDLKENIRWKDGVMEWYDEQDFQWKPARYHRDCRMELIADAARQPGAPIWTADMGDDCTSFSPLTQGWNRNPSSVVNYQGVQVFTILERPESWNIIPPYDHLIHRGCILLDNEDKPVRDIPGLPLTLSWSVKGWFLGGLRRCLQLGVTDITARIPPTRVTKTGKVKKTIESTMTMRISRWQKKNGIPEWAPREHKPDQTDESSTEIPEVPITKQTDESSTDMPEVPIPKRARKRKVVKKRKSAHTGLEVQTTGMETDIGSNISGNESVFASSLEATPSVGPNGYTEMPGTHYPLLPLPSTPLAFEYPPPPRSNSHFGGAPQGMGRIAGDSLVGLGTPPWELADVPGSSDPLRSFDSAPTDDLFLSSHPGNTQYGYGNGRELPYYYHQQNMDSDAEPEPWMGGNFEPEMSDDS